MARHSIERVRSAATCERHQCSLKIGWHPRRHTTSECDLRQCARARDHWINRRPCIRIVRVVVSAHPVCCRTHRREQRIVKVTRGSDQRWTLRWILPHVAERIARLRQTERAPRSRTRQQIPERATHSSRRPRQRIDIGPKQRPDHRGGRTQFVDHIACKPHRAKPLR